MPGVRARYRLGRPVGGCLMGEPTFTYSELYRNEHGHELWRVRDAVTGAILIEGIANDYDHADIVDALEAEYHSDATLRDLEGTCKDAIGWTLPQLTLVTLSQARKLQAHYEQEAP